MRLAPSPDWSVRVTEANVHELPIEAGFVLAGLNRLVRPVGFVVPEIHTPTVLVSDESGALSEAPIGQVPHMRPFGDYGSDAPGGSLVTLHHRKGGASEREPHFRILRLAGLGNSHGHPATEIHYGEHPDHPGELGFYVRAEHVGQVNPDYSGVQYLDPSQVAMKFFPIEAGAKADITP